MVDRDWTAEPSGDAWDHPDQDLQVGRGCAALVVGTFVFGACVQILILREPDTGPPYPFYGAILLVAVASYAVSSLVTLAVATAKRLPDAGRLLGVAVSVSTVPIGVLWSAAGISTDIRFLVLGAAWTVSHFGAVAWLRPGPSVAWVVLMCGVVLELVALSMLGP